jgi:inhibitor of KinA sporulation pathway (predicted exonuclease)
MHTQQRSRRSTYPLDKRDTKQLQLRQQHQPLQYYIVVDFEATCEENNVTFENEIIEFPLVLLKVNRSASNQAEQLELVDHLQLYIKPTVHQILSPFCTQLTGITQANVDQGIVLETALQQVHDWLVEKKVISGTMDEWMDSNKQTPFAFITDGPYDLYNFLHRECEMKNIKKPVYYSQWNNIRLSFSDLYGLTAYSLMHMMNVLGIPFNGRHHSGIDDSLNIAKIAMRIVSDRGVLNVNDQLTYHIPRLVPQAFTIGVVLDVVNCSTESIEIKARAINTCSLEQHGSDFEYNGDLDNFLKEFTRWLRSNNLIKSRFSKSSKKQKNIMSHSFIFRDSSVYHLMKQIITQGKDEKQIPKFLNKHVNLSSHYSAHVKRFGLYSSKIETGLDHYVNIMINMISTGTVLYNVNSKF